MARCKRIRRCEVSPDVWLAHRKQRKKVASAKWYAQKKQREIDEENQLRWQLEQEYRAKQARSVWTPTMQAYHRAALDHIYRGYPVRPEAVPPLQWVAWADMVEEQLRASETTANGLWDHIPWDHPDFRKCLRQLGMREARWNASRTSHPRERATSISSAADAKRADHMRNHAMSSSLTTCSVLGVVFAGLAQRGLHHHWPWVLAQMNHVFQPSNTNDHNAAYPLAHRMPPSQKPTQKTQHILDWIQQYVFPEPTSTDASSSSVALDHSDSEDEDLDDDQLDYLHDTFGIRTGYGSDDSSHLDQQPLA